MILMLCVDQNNGLRFNHRRQSRDRICRERQLIDCGGTLGVSPGTAALFEESQQSQLRISESFLQEAGPGDFCFAEAGSFAPLADRIEQVILYRWDKVYPADEVLDLDLHSAPWVLSGTEVFEGSSHKEITREVYAHQ